LDFCQFEPRWIDVAARHRHIILAAGFPQLRPRDDEWHANATIVERPFASAQLSGLLWRPAIIRSKNHDRVVDEFQSEEYLDDATHARTDRLERRTRTWIVATVPLRGERSFEPFQQLGLRPDRSADRMVGQIDEITVARDFAP
jgi:hypothetical protein